jgi:hypothetical protein
MEVKIEYDELETKLDEKYDEGFEDGKAHGVSLVMKWLQSGKGLKDFLVENDILCAHVDVANLQQLNWFVIEKAINALIIEALACK